MIGAVFRSIMSALGNSSKFVLVGSRYCRVIGSPTQVGRYRVMSELLEWPEAVSPNALCSG